MFINVDEKWRILSDIQSWKVRRRRGKGGGWRSIAWARNLDDAKRYLLQRGIPQARFDALEEIPWCKDSPKGCETEPFCWQFDQVFLAGSPEAESLAKITVPSREGAKTAQKALKRSGGISTPPRQKQCVSDGQMRLERRSTKRLSIAISDRWRIREDRRAWVVESRMEIKSETGREQVVWKFEASCIHLLDAMNTLLQRRIWMIEGSNPKEIVQQRDAIRSQIISAWQRVARAMAA